MSLREFATVVTRRRWVIGATALIAIVVVLAAMLFIPPVYTSTARVRVITPETGSVDYLRYDLSYADRIMGTLIQMATSTPVLAELQGDVGFPADDPPEIVAESVPGTELLQLTVKHTDPTIARDTADALAYLLANQRTFQGINIDITDPPSIPEPPTLFNNLLLIGLGVLVGTLGGVGLAFVMEAFDNRAYSTRQIANLTGLPVVGEIPNAPHHTSRELLLAEVPYSEAIRRLRTNILAANGEEGLRSILVTSAGPAEGKTTVATNLAISMAQTGRRVMLIDTDIRQPKVHEVFDLNNEKGLSAVLHRRAEWDDVKQPTGYHGLDVIVTGPPQQRTPELLDQATIGALIDDLTNYYDFVILDGSPFLLVADAAMFVSVPDGVLLIVRSGWAAQTAIEQTRLELQSLRANVLGVVVNRAESPFALRHRYYYDQPLAVVTEEKDTDPMPALNDAPDTSPDPERVVRGVWGSD